MSINSIRNLFADMKSSYGITYLLTYKLNQDVLESFFGQIRQKGGGPNNHPPPLDALNRMRLIILGRGLKNHLGVHGNSQQILLQEDFLITRIFKGQRKNNSAEDGESDDLLLDDTRLENNDWKNDETKADTNMNKTLQEQDGFEYAMGFVAKKLKSSNPELGEFTYASTSEHNNSYVMNLSHGGLTRPKDDWLDSASLMDETFNRVHGGKDTLLKVNSKATTLRVLKNEFPDKTDKELKAFINTKFNIRIRYMNKKISEEKYIKYKQKQASQNKPRSGAERKNNDKIRQFRN